jgi:very-short-patch-repair endonuclease
MQDAVANFIRKVEDKAHKLGKARFHLNEIEVAFLVNVFGPEFNYDFEGLEPQFHFKDYKGGNRYVDFVFIKGHIRIIIEIDGRRWHVTDITIEQYDDHQERQNDIILNGGFLLLRFTANMVMNKPMVCRRQLIQAVGRCYATSTESIPSTVYDLQALRKGKLQLLADKSNGILKPASVAEECGIPRRTAAYWLQQLSKEGTVEPIIKEKRVIGYRWSHR